MLRCKYCKDTGMVDLLTGSRPCLDCPPPEPIMEINPMAFKYGWFSHEAKERFGSIRYISFDNPAESIEVTAVIDARFGNDKEYPTYGWRDKIFVGRVTNYIYGTRTEPNILHKERKC